MIHMPSQRQEPPHHQRKWQHTRTGYLGVHEGLSMKLNWFASFRSFTAGGGGSSASAASAASAVPDSSASPSPAACKKIKQ